MAAAFAELFFYIKLLVKVVFNIGEGCCLPKIGGRKYSKLLYVRVGVQRGNGTTLYCIGMHGLIRKWTEINTHSLNQRSHDVPWR